MIARHIVLRTYVRVDDVIPIILGYADMYCGCPTCCLQESAKRLAVRQYHTYSMITKEEYDKKIVEARYLPIVKAGPFCHYCCNLFHARCYGKHLETISLPPRDSNYFKNIMPPYPSRKRNFTHLRYCSVTEVILCFDCEKNVSCECKPTKRDWAIIRRWHDFTRTKCPKCNQIWPSSGECICGPVLPYF